VNFALPLGFCLLNGYWLAVCAGIALAFTAFILLGGFLRPSGLNFVSISI
jgi:hypothetical protein